MAKKDKRYGKRSKEVQAKKAIYNHDLFSKKTKLNIVKA
jgi:hypothetical protein